MASITVFDPDTGNTQSVTIELAGAVIVQDLDGQVDYYIKLSTGAKTKAGADIASTIIRDLEDGPAGTPFKHDGTPTPYDDYSEAISDHIRRMVEGVPGQPTTAMSFA